MQIGFIGLGIMGSRMAANLQKVGHDLVVYNRTKEKAEALIKEGAQWCDTPAQLAVKVDILFTMLASPEAVSQVALGNDGYLSIKLCICHCVICNNKIYDYSINFQIKITYQTHSISSSKILAISLLNLLIY